eukprot:6193854-Pleurochrysis_carterae.AAC.3
MASSEKRPSEMRSAGVLEKCLRSAYEGEQIGMLVAHFLNMKETKRDAKRKEDVGGRFQHDTEA